MKLNRKIIIPAATLLVGVALAGSATSTIAWYQYSTKANVAYLGTSAGTSANLLVRIKGYNNDAENGGWGSFIGYDDVDNFLGAHTVKPVTSGAMGRDEAIKKDDQEKLLLYSNPVYGNGPLDLWNKAPVTSYVQIPLQFKFVENDGTTETLKAKDLFISDLLIKHDYSNASSKIDLSSAIRVHFDGYQDDAQPSGHFNRLASKVGGNTLTVGQLDLNGDEKPDKSYDLTDEAEHAAMYGFGGDEEYLNSKGTPIDYGKVTGQTDNNQVSYSATDIVNKKLGTTSADESKLLNVLVTIWIEGWQELPNPNKNNALSSMWDLVKTVDSKFDVGMQFEAKDAQ